MAGRVGVNPKLQPSATVLSMSRASDTCCEFFCSPSPLQKYPWCEWLSHILVHWILFSVQYAFLTKVFMSETERVPYVVGWAEAEEIIEHQAYNKTERKQVKALTVYETNVWFALRIKKRDIKEAVEWRVNIAASSHTICKTLVNLASPLCFLLSHFLEGFHEYNCPPVWQFYIAHSSI